MRNLWQWIRVWFPLHNFVRISRVSCGRPCTLPLDDSFVHKWPSWMFGLWLTDEPYGRTRDEQFLLSHQLPPCPRVVQGFCLGFNAHIYGPDLTLFSFSFFLYFILFSKAMCHDFLGWPVVSFAFFKGTAMCRLLNGWRCFADPASGPYK